MGLNNRLERLEMEQVARVVGTAPGGTPEKMVEKLADELDFHVSTDTPINLCRYELELIAEDPASLGSLASLPEEIRDLVRLQRPGYAAIRMRYENPPEEPFEGWREKVRKHRERVQAFSEESRRRGAELIARNRKACGLPPLESGR